jgi:hypothetical protein
MSGDASASERQLSLSLSLSLARARARSLFLSHSLSLARSRALSLVRARSLFRSLALARVRARAFSLSHNTGDCLERPDQELSHESQPASWLRHEQKSPDPAKQVASYHVGALKSVTPMAMPTPRGRRVSPMAMPTPRGRRVAEPTRLVESHEVEHGVRLQPGEVRSGSPMARGRQGAASEKHGGSYQVAASACCTCHGISRSLLSGWHLVHEPGESATFEGDWQQGVRCGHGTWKSARGGSYDGAWNMDHFCGEGTFCFAEGDVFQGTFANGKPLRGILRKHTGRQLRVTFPGTLDILDPNLEPLSVYAVSPTHERSSLPVAATAGHGRPGGSPSRAR